MKKIFKILTSFAGMTAITSSTIIFTSCAKKDINLPEEVFNIDENGVLQGFQSDFFNPDSEIYKDNFKNCNVLQIPTRVKSINSKAFYVNDEVTGWHTTIPEYVTKLTFGKKCNLSSLGSYAFSSCSSITLVDLSQCINLTTIGAFIFQYCTSLTSVIFPSSLKTIAGYAFSGCSSLKSINFSNCPNLTDIERFAFENCSSIQEVDFSNNKLLKFFSGGVFRNCPSIKDIKIDNDYFHILSLGENGKVVAKKEETSWTDTSKIQGSLALGEIVIPNGITSINSKAFGGCSTITSISFLSPLSLIGNSAFSSCTSLSRINWNFTNEFNDVVIETFAFNNIADNNCKIRCTAPDKHTSQALLDWLQDKDGGYASPKGKFPTSGWEAIN